MSTRALALIALVVVVLAILAGGVYALIGVQRGATPAPTPLPVPFPKPVPTPTPTPTPTPAPAQPTTIARPARSPADAARLDQALNAALRLKTDREWGRARALLHESIDQWPDEQLLHVSLAEVLVAQEEHTLAHASYERALATGARTAGLEFAAGSAASAAGLNERALEHFAAAQTADPTDPLPPLFLAQVQLRTGDLAGAKKNLLISARLKDDIATTWGTLAEIALRENALSLAVQHARKARDLEPESTVWRIIEARALKRDNKPAMALALFENAEPKDLLEPATIQLLHECYGLAQRPQDAAAMFERLANADATRGDLALDTARWWQRAGNKAKARQWAERAGFVQTPGAAELLAELK